MMQPMLQQLFKPNGRMKTDVLVSNISHGTGEVCKPSKLSPVDKATWMMMEEVLKRPPRQYNFSSVGGCDVFGVGGKWGCWYAVMCTACFGHSASYPFSISFLKKNHFCVCQETLIFSPLDHDLLLSPFLPPSFPPSFPLSFPPSIPHSLFLPPHSLSLPPPLPSFLSLSSLTAGNSDVKSTWEQVTLICPVSYGVNN